MWLVSAFKIVCNSVMSKVSIMQDFTVMNFQEPEIILLLFT